MRWFKEMYLSRWIWCFEWMFVMVGGKILLAR